MILTLKNNSYTFENSEGGVQAMFETINKFLMEEDVYFSHLVIDGREIYEDYDAFFLDNIENITKVEVKVNTIKEFISNLLVSLNAYTYRAIPEIENLINDFYQTPTEQSWIKLNQLLEGINWIYDAIKNIDVPHNKISYWDELIKSAATFEVELPNFMEAIENKDNILIADIIHYEFLPQFQLIYNETEKNFAE